MQTKRSDRLDLDCYFCGAKLIRSSAWLQIYDRAPFQYQGSLTRFNYGGREALAYPGAGAKGWRRVVVFAHTYCGPDCGYNISFDRLHEDDWDEHLREKTWWCPSITEAFNRARKSWDETQ